MKTKKDDIIYILVNEAMPGYIKIGRTNNLKRRIKDLDWTNMPLPFQCRYAATVKNSSFVEKQILTAFEDNKARSNREFFKINPERVVAIIKLVQIKEVTPKQLINVTSEIKEELNTILKKRFNFQAVGIPIGSELHFIRDKKIKAKVTKDNNIEINGKEKSLSSAAQDLLHVSYPVQGPIYWVYRDETLDEIRRRLELEN